MTYELGKPDYNIHLRDLSTASFLLQFCKTKNIRNYAYAFVFNSPFAFVDEILKIGRSAGGEIGERIYRQAGHIPGWNTVLHGPSGSDILEVIKLYETLNPASTGLLNTSNISIRLWDVTGAPNPHISDVAYPTRVCENQLLTEYEELTGMLPVGNLKDTRNEMMKPFVSTNTWNSLFEEVDTASH